MDEERREILHTDIPGVGRLLGAIQLIAQHLVHGVGGSQVEADFTEGRSVGPGQFYVETVGVKRAQNRWQSCLYIHALGELQQHDAQILSPTLG